ncbi:MAG: outer membrane protein assembly factor BamA [Enterobacteriaceae bacterium]
MINILIIFIIFFYGGFCLLSNKNNILEKSLSNFRKVSLIKKENYFNLPNLEENCKFTIKKILINNISNLHKTKILNFINKNHICSGSYVRIKKINKLKKKLEKFYKNSGYINAKINIKIKIFKNRNLVVFFIINEGSKYYLKNVCILGNNFFSKKEINKNFKNYDFLDLDNRKKIFKINKFFHDLSRLKKYYFYNGFFDFSIILIKNKIEKNTNNVFVEIFIKEGCRYELSKTILYGYMHNYFKEIKNIVDVVISLPYKKNNINIMIKKIKDNLCKNGYIYPYIKIYLKSNFLYKKLVLFIYIDIGKKYYVRNVHFFGDLRKDLFYIFDIIKKYKNEVINCSLINLDKERIKKINNLKKAKLIIRKVFNTNKVDLIYYFKEDNKDEINIGLNLEKFNKGTIYSSFRKKNILKFNNNLDFDINLNKNMINYKLFFNINDIKKNLSLSNIFFYCNDMTEKMYKFINYGFDSGLNFNLYKNNKLSLFVEYEHFNILSFLYNNNLHDYLDKTNLNVSYPIIFDIRNLYFHFNFLYDTSENVNFPSYGNKINLDFKFTVPRHSDNNYYVFSIDLFKYFKIKNYFILSNNMYLSYIDGLKDKKIPYYEYFYFKKRKTIRGLFNNFFGSKILYYDTIFYRNDFNKQVFLRKSNETFGGDLYFFLNSDLFFPIPLMYKYNDNIRISLFSDVGFVFDKKWKNTDLSNSLLVYNYDKFNQLRITTGISLKIFSNIGEILISYGIPLKKNIEDKVNYFQIKIKHLW